MHPRQRPLAPSPPDPEDLFERWLDDVYPVLKETWLAGWYARNQQARPRPAPERAQPKRKPAEVDDRKPYPGVLWEIPSEEMPPGWRKVYHLRGEQPCRQAGLIVTQALNVTNTYRMVDVCRKVNGQPLSSDDLAVCGFCGYELYETATNRDLDWTPHIVTPSNLSVSFGDEHTEEPAVHPQDAFDHMVSEMDKPLNEEILDGPQTVDLMTEAEEEGLRELGAALNVYTVGLPDAKP